MLNNEDKINVVIEQGSWREIASVLEDSQDCIAFLDGDVRFKRGEFISLGQSELVLALPRNNPDPSLEKREALTWSDIPESAIIFTGICPHSVQQVYSQLRATHRSANGLVEVGCAAVLTSCIEQGELPVLLPQSLLPALCQGQPVQYVPLAYSKIFVPFGLYIPHGNHLRRLLAGKGKADNIISERLFNNNLK